VAEPSPSTRTAHPHAVASAQAAAALPVSEPLAALPPVVHHHQHLHLHGLTDEQIAAIAAARQQVNEPATSAGE
jgi:hypothetical protein